MDGVMSMLQVPPGQSIVQLIEVIVITVALMWIWR